MSYEDDLLGILGAQEIQDAQGDDIDLAEALARVNPVADQLQHFANMRAIKHALLDRAAPFARNNPPSVLKGTLGNQATLFPLTGGNGNKGAIVKQQVANWTGASDAETTPVTVVLGSIIQPPLGVESNINQDGIEMWGIIQFGTQSSLLTVEVDIGRGCEFTIGASMVTVQVAARCGVSCFPGDGPTLLSGMLSFHPIVNQMPITRTVYIPTALNGAMAPEIYEIPAFAKQLIVVKRNTTEVALNTLVTFYCTQGTPVLVQAIATNTQFFDPIPVPPDAVRFSVGIGTYGADYTGGDVASRAIFELSL